MSDNFSRTRRDFLAGTVAAGFALAVQPIAASTLFTDANGLITADITIPVAGGTIPGYYAMPDKAKGKPPVVLVVHEVFGVHEHIKDLCRRLAKQGYLAVAPDLFSRLGDATKVADVNTLIKDMVSKTPDAQVMSDLDAAVEWAGKSGNGDTNKLAITGFCWGGRIVWLYAAHNQSLKTGAAWYGRIVGDTSELQPKNPIDLVADIKAPILGLYGGLDQGIPVDTVHRMERALKEAGNRSKFIIYPNAGHAFNADYRPSYVEEAAKDAWKNMLRWFNEHGVA